MQTGQGGRKHAVRMNDSPGVGTRPHDVEVKAPFAGRFVCAVDISLQIHMHDILWRKPVVRDAGRRYEKAVGRVATAAHAHISGGALIQSHLVHAQAGVDHLLPQGLFSLVTFHIHRSSLIFIVPHSSTLSRVMHFRKQL